MITSCSYHVTWGTEDGKGIRIFPIGDEPEAAVRTRAFDFARNVGDTHHTWVHVERRSDEWGQTWDRQANEWVTWYAADGVPQEAERDDRP